MTTYRFLGLIKNDDCYCNTCWQAKRAEEYRRPTEHKPKIFNVTRTSVLNNLYSKDAVSSHLNLKHDDYLVDTEFIDDDGRTVPKQYKWKGPKGHRAVMTFIAEGNKKNSYEKYSNLIVLTAGVQGQLCRLLLDTGAEVDVLDEDWLRKHKDRFTIQDVNVKIQLAESEVLANINKEVKQVRIDLFPGAQNKKNATRTDMLIMRTGSNGQFDGIIGLTTMQALGIKVTIPKMSDAAAAAERENDEDLKIGYAIIDDDDDDKELLVKIQTLIHMNQTIETANWCTMKNGVVDFELNESQMQEAYRKGANFVSLAFFESVDEQIDKWMKSDVIELNNEKTPINLPLIAVKQNNTDGTLKKIRVCVDFRKLNRFLVMDSYPIPKWHEMNSIVMGCKHFTVIDLESGYNQIEVAERARKFMAFTWRGIQYRFKGTPFGLNFLPSQFNRMLSHHLAGIPGVIVYIDDIFICSKTRAQHHAAVKEVLERLNSANMRINKKKCEFGKNKVTFLGFQISENGIEVDADRIRRLTNLQLPKTAKELQSYLAMANYIRQHIPNFGKVTAVLYDIAAKAKKLSNYERWATEGIDAWQKLKLILQSPIVLKYPDPKLSFTLRTDACTTGYGGYLYQEEEDGTERIIQTFSGNFKSAQMGYSIPKKELFAIIYAFRHLGFYLRGSKFLLQTDANCLTNLHHKDMTCETVAKWMLEISALDYEIEHIKGEENIFADLLSRQSCDQTLLIWNNQKPSFINPDDLQEEKCNVGGIPKKLYKISKATTVEELDDGYNKRVRQRICKLTTQTNKKIPFDADTYTSDWKLNPKYFQKAERRWGPHTIDLFAARHNAQTERFFWEELNAFSMPWKGENPWINPPWQLIARVLNRIQLEKIEATICVPYYFNASWWKLLKEMTIEPPLLLARNKDIFLRHGCETVGETPWSTTIIARVSGRDDRKRVWIDWTFGESLEKMHSKIAVREQHQQVNSLIQRLQRSEGPGGRNWQAFHEPLEEAESRRIGVRIITRQQARYELSKSPQPVEEDPSDEPENHKGKNQLPMRVLTDYNELEDGGVIASGQLDSCHREECSYSFATKKAITQQYHDIGHQSEKTVARLLKRTGGYDWPDLTELVQQVNDECLHCELKQVERTGYHPLRSNRSQFVGDIWVIDLIQVPRHFDTKDNDAFLLHVLDHWSSYSFLRALPNKESATIAHHLVSIMMEHGCPKTIMHDGGSEFMGSVKLAVEQIAWSYRIKGAPYHAQTQGANERKHKEIKEIIIELLSTDTNVGSDWKRVLPFTQMKVNLQVNRRHGSTPFAVYYGRTHNIFNTNDKHNTEMSWLEHIKKYDNLIIPVLTEKMNKYYDLQELQFFRGHEESVSDITVGALVKVRVTGQPGQTVASALSYQWKGPFRVIAKVRGGYDVGYPNPSKQQRHVKLNSDAIPREQIAVWRRSTTTRQHSNQWEVVRIMDERHKVLNGKKMLEYRLEWAGNWSPTWEPAANVSTALRDRYLQSKKATAVHSRVNVLNSPLRLHSPKVKSVKPVTTTKLVRSAPATKSPTMWVRRCFC